MTTYYLIPFKKDETDLRIPFGHEVGWGSYLEPDGWKQDLAKLKKTDQLAIYAHGNNTLLLCSARTAVHYPNRAWIGPHPLWALINPYLSSECKTIIIQGCYSVPFGEFFTAYMKGRDMWAFEGELRSEEWRPDSPDFTKVNE